MEESKRKKKRKREKTKQTFVILDTRGLLERSNAYLIICL